MKARSIVAASCAAVLAAGATAAAQSTTRVSVDSSGLQANQESDTWSPAISADGATVAFYSLASNLVANDLNFTWDCFVRAGATTERVSVDSSGVEGNSVSWGPSLSADGRIVAFQSLATNLVPNFVFQGWQVFVRDRNAGTTTLASVDSSGNEANGACGIASISSNGRFVAFSSIASNLVSGDTGGIQDVFVHDLATGTTERVSVDSSGVQGDSDSDAPAISGDGRFVVFHSLATNLVASDLNGCKDVFVHDRVTGTTRRVSVDSAGGEANAASSFPSISDDGAAVSFNSQATNLVASDTNGFLDAFAHDLATGATERVDVSTSGGDADSPVQDFAVTSISRNGRLVAFASGASNLIASDTNRAMDVFVRDRATGITYRESVDSSGAQANDYSLQPSLSPDGESLAFTGFASNLVTGDTNGSGDVFVRRRCQALATNYGSGLAGTLGVPTLVASADPVLGATIDVDLGSSLTTTTAGFLLGGLQPAALPYKGGTLLVSSLFVVVPLSVPAGGRALPFTVPNDPALCGFSFDLQAFEADAGAVRGLSMTPGLELTLGN
jgi:Tol biopolymer transport system component